MLYNRNWLNEGEVFPPVSETSRLLEYEHNRILFDLTDRDFKPFEIAANRLISDWQSYIKFPLILAYQRLMTIKLADMIVGTMPTITAGTDALSTFIQEKRTDISFDEKVYSSVIDFSRYGVTVFRLFNNESNQGDFTCWDPSEWFPILYDDGTKRIKEHVLVWRSNIGTASAPTWRIHTQIHPVTGQKYVEQSYDSPDGKSFGKKLSENVVKTNSSCFVQYAANIPTTSNIYGTSDYTAVNQIVLKAMERIVQILNILDRHSDPSMTGPVSLLEQDESGNLVLKLKQFYGVSEGETPPSYLTWDGKLDSAFKALEILLNQLYVISEMGAAFLGTSDSTGQAISGTAMRFKMASPLIKARRVKNSLTLPLKRLITGLGEIDGQPMKFQDITIQWDDSLPKDPREQVELIRLETGLTQIMPLRKALMDEYDMKAEDADKLIKEILKEQELFRASTDNATQPNVLQKGSVSAATAGTEGSTGTKNVVNPTKV